MDVRAVVKLLRQEDRARLQALLPDRALTELSLSTSQIYDDENMTFVTVEELEADPGIQKLAICGAGADALLRVLPPVQRLKLDLVSEEPLGQVLRDALALAMPQELALRRCWRLGDLAPLEPLEPRLRRLSIWHCGAGDSGEDFVPMDLGRINRFQNLEVLDVTSLDSATKLAGLSALTDLTVRETINDLSGMGDLRGLRRVRLSFDVSVDSLSPLSSLTELEELDLNAGGSKIRSLAPLENMTKLQRVKLAFFRGVGTPLRVDNMTRLQSLELRCMEKMMPLDLSPLRACLQTLALEQVLFDPTSLAQLTELRDVELISEPPVNVVEVVHKNAHLTRLYVGIRDTDGVYYLG